MKNIIQTEVWSCSKTEDEIQREKDLGVKIEGLDDEWMPLGVDFNEVIAIKQAAYTEFLGGDRATVYFNDERFTINMSFTEAMEIWKKSE